MDQTISGLLSTKQVAELLGLSSASIYKMTSNGSIPHYKPNGGRLYFLREEVETWVCGKRSSTREELEAMALTIRNQKLGGKR